RGFASAWVVGWIFLRQQPGRQAGRGGGMKYHVAQVSRRSPHGGTTMSRRLRSIRHAAERRHPAQAHIDRGYEALGADREATAAREWLSAWEILRRDPGFEEVVRWEPADPSEPKSESGPTLQNEGLGDLSHPVLSGSAIDPFFVVTWFEELIRLLGR